MARLPLLVIPGHPHHVTQRGNRRAQTFFESGDYALYKDLLSEAAQRANAEIWCYCLMPNHVHIIIVPSDEDGLRRTFADAHRRYTGYINTRLRVTGHLWQGRFGSVVMDEAHLANAVRYGDVAAFLDQEENAAAVRLHRESETTGCPLGSVKWIEMLEKLTSRQLKLRKRGSKGKIRGDD